MYVTAHRIRTPSHEEGINAYYYTHGARPWAAPPNPESEPGTLVRAAKNVSTVGGNQVRSYFDVIAPDTFFWPEIKPLFLRFVEAAKPTPFPWALVVGACLFRAGVDHSLAPEWRRELGLLYKACMYVHPVRLF